MTDQTGQMVHLSGTFSYERPAAVEGREGQVEFQEPAFYIGITLRNDDGSPLFIRDSDLNITAVVMLSRPQQLFDEGFDGYLLHLTLDFINASYLGFTATLDPSYGTVPASWLPLAILIWVGPPGGGQQLPAGIITAAPYPLAVSGVAPPESPILQPPIAE